MNCNDCHDRIGELLDAGHDARQDTAVGRHLAGCPACRAFRDTWAVLDERLTRLADGAAMPPDFKARLLAKLPAPRPRLLPAEVVDLRAQFEREHRQAIVMLQRRHLFLDVATWLRFSAISGGFIVAAVFLNALVKTLPEAVGTVFGELETVTTTLVLSLGVAFAAMLFGLSRVWRPFRRLMPAW